MEPTAPPGAAPRRSVAAVRRAVPDRMDEEEDSVITALTRREHGRSMAAMAAIVVAALALAASAWVYGADAQTRLQEALTSRPRP